MNKPLLYLIAAISISIIFTEKVISRTLEDNITTEKEQFSKVKTNSGLTREQIAKKQSEWQMQQAPKQDIGTTELGQNKYDKEITSYDQTIDLNKTRNDLKENSNNKSTIVIVFIVVILIIISFVLRKVKNKQDEM